MRAIVYGLIIFAAMVGISVGAVGWPLDTIYVGFLACATGLGLVAVGAYEFERKHPGIFDGPEISPGETDSTKGQAK